jgi:hypothetical protein
MNLPCVAGCSDITVDEKKKVMLLKGKQYKEGVCWIFVERVP